MLAWRRYRASVVGAGNLLFVNDGSTDVPVEWP